MAKKEIKQDDRRFDINQEIISNIDNGILVLDDELRIHSFNRWVELHTGLKEESVINKKITDIFKDINAKKLTRKIKTAIRMQAPTFYTSTTSKYLIPMKIDKIGTSKYSLMQQDVSIIPLSKEKGLVALNITDQTNLTNINSLLEENITEVEELHKEVIEEREIIDERVLFVKFNKELVITDMSKAYLELAGYKKDELLGKSFFKFKKYNFSKELKESIIEHIKTQKVFKFEYKTTIKDTKEMWFRVTQVPEYDISGNHIGFMLFKENITDSKELHIHQEQIILNSRFTAMGEMIGMIAHQWRQPLSLMSSTFMNIELKRDLDTLNTEYVTQAYKDIRNTIQYLSTIIDDFRDYFKEDEAIEERSFHNILDKTKTLIQSTQQSNHIICSYIIDEDLKISTYQNKLVQVIINILKNSIDAFKNKKTEDREIIIKAIEDGNYVSLHIIDNGGGIDQEIIKQVFEPYFSTKSKNRTGLGLFMCKKIVQEDLNGSISITSKNEKTDVFIKLPLHLKVDTDI